MASAVAVRVLEDVEQAAALLHPVRLRILRELAEPDSAAGVARKLDLPRQQVNYHLREMEKRKLVECVGEQRRGNCMERLMRAAAHSYVISPAVLGSIGADPARVEDRFSSAYLVAVAAQAIRDVAVLRTAAEKAGKALPTMTLQTEVRFASAAAQATFAEELAAALTQLAAKYHDEEAERGRAFRFFVGGYPKITRALGEREAAEETT